MGARDGTCERHAMNRPTAEPTGLVPASARARGRARGHGPTEPASLRAAVAPSVEGASLGARFASGLQDFSPLDWLVVVFFSVLVLAVVAGTGIHRGQSLAILGVDRLTIAKSLALTPGRRL